MRVLYLLGPGELAGIQRHVQALVRCMPEWVEPHVAFLFGAGEGSRQIAAEGVPVTILGGRSGHDLRLAPRLLRLLRHFEPDVVHEHEAHLSPLLVLQFWRQPVLIHTEHCSLTRFTSLWKTRLIYRLIVRRAGRVIAVSEATRQSVIRHAGVPPKLVETIPNGIDLRAVPPPADLRRELGLPRDSVLVGAVGRLAEGKGWFDFIETASRLAALNEKLHVVIAGDGPLASEIAARIEATGLAHRFHLLGSRADGAAVIAGLDLFLLTSIHEEMPTTVLEAFAAGTPVAGFIPEGGLAEVLAAEKGKTFGVFVESRDVEQLASAAKGLLANADHRLGVVRAAKRFVSEVFDMRRLALVVAQRYRQGAGEASS